MADAPMKKKKSQKSAKSSRYSEKDVPFFMIFHTRNN